MVFTPNPYLDGIYGRYSREASFIRSDICAFSIDLFTDSDAILITSLFAMHCGISTVYKIKTKIIGQPEV